MTRRSFHNLLPHTCTIQTWSSSTDDAWGQPTKTWSTHASGKKCRLWTQESRRGFELINPVTGEAIRAPYQVFFPLDDDVWDSTNNRPVLTEQYRLVFTAPYNVTLNIELVSERADRGESHHLEVACNRAVGD